MTLRQTSLAVLTLALLAACSAQDKTSSIAEPDSKTVCSLDGMTLLDYPGPKGQIAYADGSVNFFCDTLEVVSMLLKPEQQKTVKGAYVQDMGKADWNKPQGNWIDARTAFYVVGSRKHGGMGPTLATFATQATADQFAKDNGGKVLAFSALTPDMVRLDGGMQHDQPM